MRSIISIILTTSLMFAVPACPQDPVAPDGSMDAGPSPVPSTTGGKVCEHLKALSCVEGTKPQCTATFDKATADNQTFYSSDCLLKAATKEAVRGCCNGVKGACSKVECP